MLLLALSDLRSIVTKLEATNFIRDNGWFSFESEDYIPYPSSNEPRWRTLLAWARKDCVERDWMFDHDEQNSWQASRAGLEELSARRRSFEAGQCDVRRCYLFTPKFKGLLRPGYLPSASDLPRSKDIYRDTKGQKWIDFIDSLNF